MGIKKRSFKGGFKTAIKRDDSSGDSYHR